MSQALSKTLVEQQLASIAQVEEALKRQVVHGGSIDTNLLEAGVLGEPEMLRALGAAYALPTAGKREIDEIAPHIPRLFPLLFAETYHLVPFRLTGSNLEVLVNGPSDRQLFERIEERLQLKVQPAVTTEVRLHYAMTRLYGTELLPRYRALLATFDGEAPRQPAQSVALGGAHVLSWGLPSGRAPGPRKSGAIRVGGLLGRLASAPDRDSVVDVLLEAVLSSFEFAALFLVQADRINGWRGADHEGSRRIARISLAVELPSVFQTIYATHGHYLGPLPGNSVNLQLIQDMGRQPPRAAFLAPVLVGGRLAAILYADNGARGVSPKRVASILLLTHRAGMCLEGLIRQRKSGSEAGGTAGSAQLSSARLGRPAVDSELTLLAEGEFETVAEAPASSPPPLPASVRKDGGGWQVAGGQSSETAAASNAAFERGLAEAAEPAAALSAALAEPSAATPESYVAFSDIDETPEESVGDWEDVLVETVGTDLPDASREIALQDGDADVAPPAVTWADVIAEAESAPQLSAPAASSNIEVAGTVVDEREILLDSLGAADPRVWQTAIGKMAQLEAAIDPQLHERFPGRLSFDPFTGDTPLPPFEQCSGVLAAIAARGAAGASIVLPHLESSDRVKRFMAIYFLYAVQYPPALELLARRLYDAESRNRFLAADALRNYRREPSYRRILQGLRDHLKVPVFEAQVATVQVLGQLRDPSAVPSLIPLVMSPRQQLARAAASTLMVICGQSFGTEVTRWAEWWREHFNKPREAWLVEGMRHSDPAVRQIAAREFRLLTGRPSPAELASKPEQT